MTDPRALIPMPDDFALQVAYWANRTRRERAEANGGTDPWSGKTVEELDQERIEEKNA